MCKALNLFMVRPLFILILSVASASFLCAGSGLTSLPDGARKFTLNNAVGQNSIDFLSEAPMETIHGSADSISGTFTMDWNSLESTRGRFSVVVRSMKTAIARRDGHMYSSAWLDADKYPEIVFDITELINVSRDGKAGKNVATATAAGMFTCHGITKPLKASVSITYLTETNETKKRASGDLVMITASFDVNLKDFNITGTGGLIGSKVGEVIRVTAHLFANSFANS